MEVIYGSLKKAFQQNEVACALGFFDGIHIGHQNLISVLKQKSKELKLKSMIFTFERHPLTVLNNEKAPKLITDNAAKVHFFNELGVDIVNFNKVDKEFLSINPEAFLQDILVDRLNVKAVISGFNFKFGFQGKGDSELLGDFCLRKGLQVNIVEPVCIDGIIVSSTVIRDFISKGNIKMANKFLGRFFSMSGRVVHGKKRGHELGFPTANINIGGDFITPKNGVYLSKVYIGGTVMTGITNVGNNPTFGSNPISVETHIIDFDENIYGKDIVIEFHDRIRDEIVFKNIDELSEQIRNDKISAVNYFKYIERT